jgi:hypothetical protein
MKQKYLLLVKYGALKVHIKRDIVLKNPNWLLIPRNRVSNFLQKSGNRWQCSRRRTPSIPPAHRGPWNEGRQPTPQPPPPLHPPTMAQFELARFYWSS